MQEKNPYHVVLFKPEFSLRCNLFRQHAQIFLLHKITFNTGGFLSRCRKLRFKFRQIGKLGIASMLRFGGEGELVGVAVAVLGQLDLELEADSWIVNDRTSELLVFETNTEIMWREALKNMGGRFSVYSNYPVDPSMN